MAFIFKLTIRREKTIAEHEYDVAMILLKFKSEVFIKRSYPGKIIARFDNQDKPKTMLFTFTAIDVPHDTKEQTTKFADYFERMVISDLHNLELFGDYAYASILWGKIGDDQKIQEGDCISIGVGGEGSTNFDEKLLLQSQHEETQGGICITFCNDIAKHASLPEGLISDDAERFVQHLNSHPVSIKYPDHTDALIPVLFMEVVRQSFSVVIPCSNPPRNSKQIGAFAECFTGVLKKYFGSERHYFISSVGRTTDIKRATKDLRVTINSKAIALLGIVDEKIPEEFLCNLTQQVMDKPVKVTKSGTYIDRRTFVSSLTASSKNPFTGEVISDIKMFPVDMILKRKIDFYVMNEMGKYFNKSFFSEDQKVAHELLLVVKPGGIDNEAILDIIMSYASSPSKKPLPATIESADEKNKTDSGTLQLTALVPSVANHTAAEVVTVDAKYQPHYISDRFIEVAYNTIVSCKFRVMDEKSLPAQDPDEFNKYLEYQGISMIAAIGLKLAPCKAIKITYERDITKRIKTFTIVLDLITDNEFKNNNENNKRVDDAMVAAINELNPGWFVNFPYQVDTRSYTSTLSRREKVKLQSGFRLVPKRDDFGCLEMITANCVMTSLPLDEESAPATFSAAANVDVPNSSAVSAVGDVKTQNELSNMIVYNFLVTDRQPKDPLTLREYIINQSRSLAHLLLNKLSYRYDKFHIVYAGIKDGPIATFRILLYTIGGKEFKYNEEDNQKAKDAVSVSIDELNLGRPPASIPYKICTHTLSRAPDPAAAPQQTALTTAAASNANSKSDTKADSKDTDSNAVALCNAITCGFVVTGNFNQYIEDQSRALVKLLPSKLSYRCNRFEIKYGRVPGGMITNFSIMMYTVPGDEFEDNAKYNQEAAQAIMASIREVNFGRPLNLIPYRPMPHKFSHTSTAAQEQTAANAVGSSNVNSNADVKADAKKLPTAQAVSVATIPAAGSLTPEPAHAELLRFVTDTVGNKPEALNTFSFFLRAINAKKYTKALRDVCGIYHAQSYELARVLLSYKETLPKRIEIDEQGGSDEYAAIHEAALNSDRRIYDLLAEHGAKTDLKDAEGNTAAKLRADALAKLTKSVGSGGMVLTMDDSKTLPINARNKLVHIISNPEYKVVPTPAVFESPDLRLMVFKNLPVKSILRFMRVSKKWKDTKGIDSIYHVPGITDSDQTLKKQQLLLWIKTFPGDVQKILISLSLKQLTNASVFLRKTLAGREEYIRSKTKADPIYSFVRFPISKDYCTDFAMIACGADIVQPDKIHQAVFLLNKLGLLMLLEELITTEQAFQLVGAQQSIVSDNGLRALRTGLITPLQVKKNQYVWKTALSNEGLRLLEEGLITGDQITLFDKFIMMTCLVQLKYFFTENGAKALREKLITPEDAAEINSISGLLSDNGIVAMREGLISISQAKMFNAIRIDCISKNYWSHLDTLLTNNGILALRAKLITPEQAAKVHELDVVLSDNGIIALKEGLITISQILRLPYSSYDSPSILRVLLSDRGINALRERIINIDELEGVTGFKLNIVVNSNWGLRALQQKLLTIDQVRKTRSSTTVDALVTELAYNALEEKLFTVNDVLEVEKRNYLCNFMPLMCESGVNALRSKKITLDQAASSKDLKKLLSDLNQPVPSTLFNTNPKTDANTDAKKANSGSVVPAVGLHGFLANAVTAVATTAAIATASAQSSPPSSKEEFSEIKSDKIIADVKAYFTELGVAGATTSCNMRLSNQSLEITFNFAKPIEAVKAAARIFSQLHIMLPIPAGNVLVFKQALKDIPPELLRCLEPSAPSTAPVVKL